MTRRPSSIARRCRRVGRCHVVNTRLGIALALGGHKAEAEAAFKQVSGPRTDLAGFWLLWLSQRA